MASSEPRNWLLRAACLLLLAGLLQGMVGEGKAVRECIDLMNSSDEKVVNYFQSHCLDYCTTGRMSDGESRAEKFGYTDGLGKKSKMGGGMRAVKCSCCKGPCAEEESEVTLICKDKGYDEELGYGGDTGTSDAMPRRRISAASLWVALLVAALLPCRLNHVV